MLDFIQLRLALTCLCFANAFNAGEDMAPVGAYSDVLHAKSM